MPFGGVMAHVQSGGLVPVLAVAKRPHLMARREYALRKAVALFFHGGKGGWVARGPSVQFLRYRNIVGRCVFERLQRQRLSEAHLDIRGVFSSLKGVEERRVAGGVGGDQHVLMVLRLSADHGRATDVDHLKQFIVGKRRRFCSCVAKGIEVASNHADRCIAKLREFFGVFFLV